MIVVEFERGTVTCDTVEDAFEFLGYRRGERCIICYGKQQAFYEDACSEEHAKVYHRLVEQNRRKR